VKPFRVVVAGGGPAGMLMAYQLASRGVDVTVLERHPDFEREFRGELLQGSVVARLEEAGLARILLDRGLLLPGIERRMLLGTSRTVKVPGPVERGAIVSQPGMLGLLHELCSRHPGYRMEFGTTVLEAVREDDRVVALRTRREGAEQRVPADLFLVCNGRNSHLRKSCGLTTKQYETTADALWLRFDFADAPGVLPTTLDVQMFGKGRVVCCSLRPGIACTSPTASPEIFARSGRTCRSCGGGCCNPSPHRSVPTSTASWTSGPLGRCSRSSSTASSAGTRPACSSSAMPRTPCRRRAARG
jgi:2-polyprenyl-6-methoxyphenol hydroxylase-like FAD-dependent oxidoreductase